MTTAIGVELRRLTKEFADPRHAASVVRAVDDVSLEVGAGEFVTLLGPSGCGKTTTLRMIAGFETPTGGEVRIDGAAVTGDPPHVRPTAMVFQSYAIFPHLSVYENVAFGLRVRGLREPAIRSRVEAMLELTELRGLGGRSPDRLSGGQQQRVALARALVTEPKVLLFDEPLSNLDAKLREQMRAEVRAIQRRLGITSLYVTHDQTEAMALSDRIVVMRQGRVEQVGTPVEVYARPASRFVADFVGRVNFLPAEAAARGRIGMRVGSVTVTLAVDGARPRPIERGLAVIRPEALRLVPSGDAPEDWPRARVRRVLYLGGVAEYEVDAGGVTLLVSMADPLATRLFAEGEPVAIRFPERPVTLVPDP